MITLHNKYAILIGVPAYSDSIKPLSYAFNDAYRMSAVLKEGGYSFKKVFLLSTQDKGSEHIYASPTRENILSVVKRVAELAQEGDSILLYFSGHAVDIFGRPYLIASDTQLDYLLSSAVAISEIYDLLKKSKCDQVFRIFDVCRTHFAQGRTLISKMTENNLAGFTEIFPGHATFISCSPGEYANESIFHKQGVFSYYLNNALSGLVEKEGNIFWDLVADYVKINVNDWCRDNGQQQTPVVKSSFNNPVVVCLAPYKEKQQVKPNIDVKKDIESEIKTDIDKNDTMMVNSHNVNALYHKNQIKPVVRSKKQVTANTFENALKVLLESTDGFIKDFSNPAISVFRTEPVTLSIMSYFVNTEFQKFLEINNPDFNIEQSKALQIFFKNSMSNVPHTSLYINLVKFPQYYWVWYCLPFETLRSEGDFVPANPLKIDYFSLREPQIYDPVKIGKIISDIFRDCTETIIQWTKELNIK